MEKAPSSSELVRSYLKMHPFASFAELKKDLNLKTLSSPWFYTIRSEMRENGELPASDESDPPLKKKGRRRRGSTSVTVGNAVSGSTSSVIEILDTIDCSEYSEDLKKQFKDQFFPILRRLHPYGESLQLAFLQDPPRMEFRRQIQKPRT